MKNLLIAIVIVALLSWMVAGAEAQVYANRYYACIPDNGEPILMIDASRPDCNPAYLREHLKRFITDRRGYVGLSSKDIDYEIKQQKKAYKCKFVVAEFKN